MNRVGNDNRHEHQGQHHLLGVCRIKQACDVSRYCTLRPGMAALLTFIARSRLPHTTFTTVALGVNTATYPTSANDCCEPGTDAHMVPLQTPTEGGRFWTEIKKGTVVQGLPKVFSSKKDSVPGQLHEISKPVTFVPTMSHGTEPWDRSVPRVSLLVYTACQAQALSWDAKQQLRALGFPMSKEHGKGGGYPSLRQRSAVMDAIRLATVACRRSLLAFPKS